MGKTQFTQYFLYPNFLFTQKKFSPIFFFFNFFFCHFFFFYANFFLPKIFFPYFFFSQIIIYFIMPNFFVFLLSRKYVKKTRFWTHIIKKKRMLQYICRFVRLNLARTPALIFAAFLSHFSWTFYFLFFLCILSRVKASNNRGRYRPVQSKSTFLC